MESLEGDGCMDFDDFCALEAKFIAILRRRARAYRNMGKKEPLRGNLSSEEPRKTLHHVSAGS
jgi:hypothetical protein